MSETTERLRELLAAAMDATGDAFEPAYQALVHASIDALPYLLDRVENTEAALAEAEIRGQMKHITAEVMRGEQTLGEKEELIADLRARLSHAEAEREDLLAKAEAHDAHRCRPCGCGWCCANTPADQRGQAHKRVCR